LPSKLFKIASNPDMNIKKLETIMDLFRDRKSQSNILEITTKKVVALLPARYNVRSSFWLADIWK